MKNSSFFFLLLFSLLSLGSFTPQKDNYSLTITINGASNSKGKMMVALFNNADQFLKTPYKGKIVDISNNQSVAVFDNVPAGTYAVSCYHDENSNQNLDTNGIGIPKEEFGFSNNPTLVFGPPSYKKSSFTLNADKSISIKLKSF